MTNLPDECAARLHQRGFRFTPQRRMILAAISEGKGHQTTEEIFDRVRRRDPGIDLSTVYRNLVFLSDMHLVVATNIGRQWVYELAMPEPHHHLVCCDCGKMSVLPANLVSDFYQSVEKQTCFRVDMDHLTLSGLCPKCAENQPAK